MVDSANARVVAQTNGSEITIVRLPLPANIRWDALLTRRVAQYRIVANRHVQVVGHGTGTVDVTRDSTVVVALRVSKRAPAGRSLGGTVEFTVGTTTAVVPIELAVPVARRLALAVSNKTLAATRGRWSTMTFRVVNDGNVDETPGVRVLLPTGWRSQVRPAAGAWRMLAGTTLDVQLRVWAPPHAGSGVLMMPLTMTLPDGSTAQEPIQVELLGQVTSGQQGATITTSVISGQAPGETAALGYGVTVMGHLTDSTRITGRLMYAGQQAPLNGGRLMLARAGVVTAPPTLEVQHPNALVSVGATHSVAPELAGHHLAGLGVVSRVSSARLSLRAFSLSPTALTQQLSLTSRAPGRYLGGDISRTVGRATSTLFASHLDDPTTRRTLDAYGLRMVLGTPGTSALIGELAYRDYARGRGLGVMTGYQHAGQRSSIDVRLMHAPGGSRGFARAVNEFTMSASRAMGTRLYLSGGAWLQDDDNHVLGAARSTGWYATPTMSLGRVGSLGLELRGTAFATSIGSSRLTNTEYGSGGTFNTDLFGVSLIGRSILARIDRGMNDPAVHSSTSRQWRVDHSVTVMRSMARGTVQGNLMYQQFAGVSGLMPMQRAAQFRADRLRPSLRLPLFLEAEVQRLQVGTGTPAYWTSRASLSLELPAGMRVSFGAERNPFLSSAVRGRGGDVLYSMRIDRSTVLPRMVASGRSRVFRDDNGNGTLDRGERGVPGVIVRCGTQRVMSDAQGRFACAERRHQIDARTVPTGLVAPTAEVSTGTLVALRVMQPLRVTLRLADADSLRVSRTALLRAVVYARDSTGAHWYARASGDGVFVVDALPIGRYHIGVDPSAIEEPLTMESGEPVVRIGADNVSPAVTVSLKARPLRIKTFIGTPTPSASTAPLPAPTATKNAARRTSTPPRKR